MTTKVSISKCVLRKCFCKLCGEDGWHVVYCNILLNLRYVIRSHLQQKNAWHNLQYRNIQNQLHQGGCLCNLQEHSEVQFSNQIKLHERHISQRNYPSLNFWALFYRALLDKCSRKIFLTIISVHHIICFHSTSQLSLHKCFQLSLLFNWGILKVSRWSPQDHRFPIHRLNSEGGNKSKFAQTALTMTSVLNQTNPFCKARSSSLTFQMQTWYPLSNRKTPNSAALLWVWGCMLLPGTENSIESHPLGFCCQKPSGIPKPLSQNILHILHWLYSRTGAYILNGH